MGIAEAIGLAALGAFAGGFGVMVGAGGGFILGPLLILVWDLEPAVAVGTSLAVVLINSLSGVWAYRQQRRIDYRSGTLFAAAAVPGSVVGAFGVELASGDFVLISFGLLLIALGIFIAFNPRGRTTANPDLVGEPHKAGRRVAYRRIVTTEGVTYEYTFNEMLAVAINGLFGFISSFFGIGGGLLRTPLLIYAFRFPIHVATATSIFAMALYTTVGVVNHALLDNIAPMILLFAGVGVVIGAQVGARLSRVIRGPWILRLLTLGLFGAGIRLLIQGAQGV